MEVQMYFPQNYERLGTRFGTEVVGEMIKTTYRATVERAGKFWVISVPAIRLLHTQSLSKNTIEPMTRDAISMMLDIEPSSFDLEFEFIPAH